MVVVYIFTPSAVLMSCLYKLSLTSSCQAVLASLKPTSLSEYIWHNFGYSYLLYFLLYLLFS